MFRTSARTIPTLGGSMAKAAGKQSGSNGETIAGYFRKVFAENPKLLAGRSNEELLRRWLADHPGEKEVPLRVKQGLQNVKSVLRSRGRRGRKAKQAKEARAQSKTAPQTRAVKNATPLSQLEALEEHIDECMALAKIIDRDKLNDVIQHLRRARNLVVWQTGE
jgi:hypothetical protein